jgi:hypothetical protein
MGRASEAKEVMMMTPEREETLERARRAMATNTMVSTGKK